MAEGELGVVLKTTPLRESDLLVVLYTATHGRVAAVARGARKSQRRFAGALQLLVLGRYQIGGSRGSEQGGGGVRLCAVDPGPGQLFNRQAFLQSSAIGGFGCRVSWTKRWPPISGLPRMTKSATSTQVG